MNTYKVYSNNGFSLENLTAENGADDFSHSTVGHRNNDQRGRQNDSQYSMEGHSVVPPEKPTHNPGQQQNRQHHPRQTGRQHQQIQPGQIRSSGP